MQQPVPDPSETERVPISPPDGRFQYAYQEALPPTVERQPGRGLVRRIETTDDATGETRVRYRPISLSQEEAMRRRMDFYHPDFGWLIDGFKHVRDRTPLDIMNDKSASVAKLP